MRLAITGSHGVSDPSVVPFAVLLSGWRPSEVLTSGAGTVGSRADAWARSQGIPCRRFPPVWDLQPLATPTGPGLADLADALLAVWDGHSQGTAGRIAAARRAGLQVYVHRHPVAPGTVFVFGANRAGRHGKGAALEARRAWGAIPGKGEGLQGRSYAIPTKAEDLSILPLEAIQEAVGRFLRFASTRRELTFLVSPIGCGLAGYTPEEIGPLFEGAPANLILPPVFLKDTRRAHQA